MSNKFPLLAFVLFAASPARAADSTTGFYGLLRAGIGYDVHLSGPSSEGAGGKLAREGKIFDPAAISLAAGWGYSGFNLQLDLSNVFSAGNAPTVGTLEVGYRVHQNLSFAELWARGGIGYAFLIDRDESHYFGATNPAGFAGTVEGGLDFFLFGNVFAVGPALLGQLHFHVSPATVLFDGIATLNFKLVL